jgi:hypothetical protein
MASVLADAIGGFNTFLAEQAKEAGETRVTVMLFDTEFEVPYDDVPISAVRPFDHESYVPRGATALLDAIGRTIDGLGKRLAATPEAERPEKVIVAILTDGEENSSREYGWPKVQSMIRHQQAKYAWDFVFLAAEQDAIASAAKMGIAAQDAHAFARTGQGVRDAFAVMDARVKEKRRMRRPVN